MTADSVVRLRWVSSEEAVSYRSNYSDWAARKMRAFHQSLTRAGFVLAGNDGEFTIYQQMNRPAPRRKRK